MLSEEYHNPRFRTPISKRCNLNRGLSIRSSPASLALALALRLSPWNYSPYFLFPPISSSLAVEEAFLFTFSGQRTLDRCNVIRSVECLSSTLLSPLIHSDSFKLALTSRLVYFLSVSKVVGFLPQSFLSSSISSQAVDILTSAMKRSLGSSSSSATVARQFPTTSRRAPRKKSRSFVTPSTPDLQQDKLQSLSTPVPTSTPSTAIASSNRLMLNIRETPGYGVSIIV